MNTLVRYLTFNELNEVDFSKQIDEEFCITLDEQKYFFFIKFNPKFNNLICFSNGAINPAKKEPPVYQRFSWRSNFKASCIFIDDPTMHGNGLKIGWGQGTKNSFALENISKIINVFMKKMSYTVDNTVFYGSSAGGYMSMYLATLIKGTRAIVNNPQCYVFKYHAINVNQMINAIYPEMSRKEIQNKFGHRISITKAFSLYKHTPEILYMQNKACTTDMRDHVKPFMDTINKYDGINEKNITFYLYNNVKEGHSPLPKEKTIQMIHNYIL